MRFPALPMRGGRSIRYYPRFPEAIPKRGAGCPRVTQPFATLCTPEGALTVRLACVRRAASVHPEPGSNSPFKNVSGMCRFFASRLRSALAGDPLIRIHEKMLGIFRSSRQESWLEAILFACLSSSISSIAVSGFQGSPRVAGAPREELLYAPLRRPCATIGSLHDFCTFGRNPQTRWRSVRPPESPLPRASHPGAPRQAHGGAAATASA